MLGILQMLEDTVSEILLKQAGAHRVPARDSGTSDTVFTSICSMPSIQPHSQNSAGRAPSGGARVSTTCRCVWSTPGRAKAYTDRKT
jgi:hypothetical protein